MICMAGLMQTFAFLSYVPMWRMAGGLSKSTQHPACPVPLEDASSFPCCFVWNGFGFALEERKAEAARRSYSECVDFCLCPSVSLRFLFCLLVYMKFLALDCRALRGDRCS